MFATNLANVGVFLLEGHPYFAYEDCNDEQEVLKAANKLYNQQ